MNPHDVILIGGGLAGLATALELALAGMRPLVLEGASTLGGRASSDVTDGYTFDRGAHALFVKGETSQFLADHHLHVPGPIASTAGSAVCVDGHWQSLPDGPFAIATASWLERGPFVRWFAGTMWGRDPGTGSAQDWLCEALPPGHARRLATALTRVSTYGGGLDRLDARTAAHHVRVGFGGVRYLEGGWQSLVEALATAARNAGAEIRVGQAVRHVASHPDHVWITTDKEVFRTPAAVVCCPPSRASRLLETPLVAAPPIEVAAMQLALDPAVLDGPVQRLAIDLRRPVFVSDFSSVVSLGPSHAHVVHAIRYLEPNEDCDARSDIEATLSSLWPRWNQGVRGQRFLPRMATTSARPPSHDHRVAQPAANIWLAGDGYAPGRMLADAAISSARRVSQQIIARQTEETPVQAHA